eukprot:COSAG06_NODE_52482_length_305_cov_0.907767_2_plen_55_part_01
MYIADTQKGSVQLKVCVLCKYTVYKVCVYLDSVLSSKKARKEASKQARKKKKKKK